MFYTFNKRSWNVAWKFSKVAFILMFECLNEKLLQEQFSENSTRLMKFSVFHWIFNFDIFERNKFFTQHFKTHLIIYFLKKSLREGCRVFKRSHLPPKFFIFSYRDCSQRFENLFLPFVTEFTTKLNIFCFIRKVKVWHFLKFFKYKFNTCCRHFCNLFSKITQGCLKDYIIN